jgi:hypothetical protein
MSDYVYVLVGFMSGREPKKILNGGGGNNSKIIITTISGATARRAQAAVNIESQKRNIRLFQASN